MELPWPDRGPVEQKKEGLLWALAAESVPTQEPPLMEILNGVNVLVQEGTPLLRVPTHVEGRGVGGPEVGGQRDVEQVCLVWRAPREALGKQLRLLSVVA